MDDIARRFEKFVKISVAQDTASEEAQTHGIDTNSAPVPESTIYPHSYTDARILHDIANSVSMLVTATIETQQAIAAIKSNIASMKKDMEYLKGSVSSLNLRMNKQPVLQPTHTHVSLPDVTNSPTVLYPTRAHDSPLGSYHSSLDDFSFVVEEPTSSYRPPRVHFVSTVSTLTKDKNSCTSRASVIAFIIMSMLRNIEIAVETLTSGKMFFDETVVANKNRFIKIVTVVHKLFRKSINLPPLSTNATMIVGKLFYPTTESVLVSASPLNMHSIKTNPETIDIFKFVRLFIEKLKKVSALLSNPYKDGLDRIDSDIISEDGTAFLLDIGSLRRRDYSTLEEFCQTIPYNHIDEYASLVFSRDSQAEAAKQMVSKYGTTFSKNTTRSAAYNRGESNYHGRTRMTEKRE